VSPKPGPLGLTLNVPGDICSTSDSLQLRDEVPDVSGADRRLRGFRIERGTATAAASTARGLRFHMTDWEIARHGHRDRQGTVAAEQLSNQYDCVGQNRFSKVHSVSPAGRFV